MYVAVTRAKRNLLVSAPIQAASGNRLLISPFVVELLGDDMKLSQVSAVQRPTTTTELLNKLQRFYPLSGKAPDKLPFERADGWLDLSVTALSQYDFCPFEFFLQHVLRISQPVGPQVGFGSVLHRVIEAYNKSRLAGHRLTYEELRLLLDQGWSNRGYSSESEARKDQELAHKTLRYFFEREEAAGRGVEGSEVAIRLEVEAAGLSLKGKIDAMFDRPDGLEIRDYKTGRNKYDADKLAKAAKENFQLRSYALTYQLLRGEAPAAVVLDYIVTGTEGEAQLTPAIMRNHADKLASMADRIRQHDFAPNPSAMHHCAAIQYYGTGEAEELQSGS
jgi:RecB family exonuclease